MSNSNRGFNSGFISALEMADDYMKYAKTKKIGRLKFLKEFDAGACVLNDLRNEFEKLEKENV